MYFKKSMFIRFYAMFFTKITELQKNSDFLSILNSLHIY
jgi:hypothetical protein